MNENTKHLIRLLAESDTTMRPNRDWFDMPHNAAIVKRQKMFLSCGLPFNLGGGDDVSRKQSERLATEMEKSGDVIFGRRKGKRTNWKLTAAADWKIRNLVGSYDRDSMIVGMLAIDAHEKWVSDKTLNTVNEEWLSGCGCQTDIERDRIFDLEQILYPALSRGLATSNSDTDGRVAYSLAPSGRAFLDGPQDEISLPAFSESASELYLDSILDARQELQNLSGENSDIVSRLSCGLWPEDSEAAAIPAVFTKDGRVRSLQNMRRAIGKIKK